MNVILKKRLFFLFAFLITLGSLYAQISYTTSFNQNKLAISIITGDDGIVYNRLSYDDEEDETFRLEGFYYISHPEIVEKWIVFSVPMDATGFSITLKEVQSERISLNHKLYPVQEPIPTNIPHTPPPFAKPDPVIYSSSAPYPSPEKRVEIVEHGFGGNTYHKLTLVLRPVSYYPTLDELELFTHLSFELNYSTLGNVAEKAGDAFPLLSSIISRGSGETQINCFLPAMLKEAHLYLFDIAGKFVKKILLTERGEVVVSVNSQEISAGMYFCNLVADGKKLGSCKVMVK